MTVVENVHETRSPASGIPTKSRCVIPVAVRAVEESDTGERTLSGVAVPWDQTIVIWGERERFERGSIDSEGALFFYQHAEPIGRLSAAEDSDAGHDIEAKFASTLRAEEAYTLAKEGVLTGLSIGFDPIEWRIERDEESKLDTIVYTKVKVREVSLVAFPAYDGARVGEVRNLHTLHPHTETKERTEHMDTNEITLEDVRADNLELRREVEALSARGGIAYLAPKRDERSAGAVLKLIASGDEETIREYNETMTAAYTAAQEGRAYTGGTTADATQTPRWVGDLTRIFDAASGQLASLFDTGQLPETGMSIEYGVLKSNSVQVTEQAAQGDDLAYGKVELETKTAPVKTYGGYTELSIQAIKRSTMPLLDRSLEALAIAAGARKKAVLRAAFDALVTARKAIATNGGVLLSGAVLGSMTPTLFTNLAIDAAVKFDSLNVELEALVAGATVFKTLANLETDGHRLMKMANEANTLGEIDIPGLNGDLVGLKVVLDPGGTAGDASFVNSDAIKQYDSPLAQLQDENIVNLSKQFSVYRFGAIAPENPDHVWPVKFAAS